MPEWLADKPGLLFVVATLLPIVSFGLLIVAGAIRWGLRPYAKDNPTANSLFQLLGGEVTGRGPAYVALAAIALAFVCSFSGFVWFLADEHELVHLDPSRIHGEHGHDRTPSMMSKKPVEKKPPAGSEKEPEAKGKADKKNDKDHDHAKDAKAKKDDGKHAAKDEKKEMTPEQAPHPDC